MYYFTQRVCLFLLSTLCIFTYHNLYAKDYDSSTMPLVFRENFGQWDKEILFKGSSSSANVFFTKTGMVVAHTRTIKKSSSEKTVQENLYWKINFEGISKDVKVEPASLASSYTNYLIGTPDKHRTNIPDYNELQYESVYNGIDLHYYSYKGELKYDFILSPGANIEDIRLNAEGISAMTINQNGELEITHEWGTVLERKPYSYQEIEGEKVEVDIRYEIKKKNTYGYKVYGKYDPTKKIIIDPLSIIWSTYVGGNNTSVSGFQYDIALDAEGNTFGTGYYPSSFPTSMGTFDNTFNGGTGDVFVYKMSYDGGSLIYSTYVGGNDNDQGMAIAVSKNGEACVAGFTFTEPSGFPTTKIFGTMVSSSNAFVFKLNGSGTGLVYSILIGANDMESALDLAITSNDEVIFVGETKSASFPMASASYDNSYNGGIYDGFYVLLNGAGNAVLSSGFLGGAHEDRATGVSVDDAGNIYITGYTGSPDFPTSSGAYDNSHNGNLDAFVVKLDPTGTALQYSTFIGGAYDDAARAIDVTPEGEAVITGYTFSPTYPKTSGGSYKGLQDVILTRFNTSGSALIYSKTFGGSHNDIGTSVLVDAWKNVYVVGTFQSTDAKDLGSIMLPKAERNSGNMKITPTVPNLLNGTYNVFLTILCDQGTVDQSAFIGGTKDDYNTPSISAKNKKRVCDFMVGFTTRSSDLATTFGAFQIHKDNGPITDQPALYKFMVQKDTTIGLQIPIKVCGPHTYHLCDTLLQASYCTPVPTLTTTCQNYSLPNALGYFSITYKYESPAKCSTYVLTTVYEYVDTTKAYILPASICAGQTATLIALDDHGNKFPNPPLDPSIYVQFHWSNGGNGPTTSVSNPGKYWLTTTNICGFPFSDTITVKTIDKPKIDLGPDRTMCFPGITVLNALNANDTLPTSYVWTPLNQKTDTIHASQPGTYCVAKTNQCGTVNDCINVNGIFAPKVALGNDTSLCNGTPITLDAGNPGAVYLWSPGGQTAQTITVSSPGSYSVTVTNSCGTGNDQINVSLVATPPNVTLGPDLLLCSPGNLPRTLDAGNPGSNYYWSNGSTNQTISASSGGQYFVTVTNGCGMDQDTLNITAPPALGLNLGPDTTLCYLATLTLNAGNPGATYLWSPGGETTQTKTVSTSGNYSVTVTNACGSASDNILVTIPPLKPGGKEDITTCPGTAVLNADAVGQSYLWSTGATASSISVILPPNIFSLEWYWVDITNTCGTARDSILLISDVPEVSISPLGSNFVCAPATVILFPGSPQGNPIWSTSDTSITITVSTSGIYWAEVSSACGTARDSIYVSIASGSPVVNLGPDQTHCTAFSTILDAGNPGSTYLWSPGGQTTQTITVNKGGLYSVKVSNGCGTGSDTLLIKSQPLTALNTDTTICQGLGAILDAGNPGSTYLWSPGGQTTQTITVNSPGTYGVTVTNSCGSISNNINVTATSSAPTVNLGPDVHSCAPASVTLDAGNAGSTYLWSTGATTQTISVSSSGKYFVKASNACGSSTDTMIVYIDNEVPVVDLGPDQTICQPVFLVLDAGSSATSYSWNTGAVSRKINVTASANYSVTATNACGNASDNVLITAVAPPLISSKDTGSCNNPITLDAGNSGSGYFWSPGGQTSQTISATTSGLYSLTISNACGLFSENFQVVVNTSVPSFNLGADTNLCTPSGLLLNASVQPGGNYVWSPGGDTTQTLLVKQAGNYSATVTNYCGSFSDNIQIAANPIAVNARFDDTICIGSSIRLYTDSLSGYSYNWSPSLSLRNPLTPSPTATPTKSTVYYVNTTDGICNNIDSVTITVENPGKPEIQVSPNSTEGYVPLKITFHDQNTVGTSYLWTFGDGDTSALKNPTHTFMSENYFHVHVIAYTDRGCKAYDSIIVKAFTLFIPNLITPNGDGKNDRWELTKLHEKIYVEIFNRWGEKVYVQDNYVDQWDGANLSDGIYYYLVEDKLYGKQYKGWVEILR